MTRKRSADVAFFLATGVTPFLEPEVLERLGGTAVQVRCLAVVAEPGLQVTLRDPGRGLVAGGRELCEACLGQVERLTGLVEALERGLRGVDVELDGPGESAET